MHAIKSCLVSVTALALLSACSTIVEGTTNNINVTTTPATQATCTLKNNRESVTAITPGTVMIKKSISDIDVNCKNSHGATGQTKLASDVDAWDFGNILIGGLIGAGIDWISGAAYKYPDAVMVPLQ